MIWLHDRADVTTRYIRKNIYVWKLNQRVPELYFWAQLVERTTFDIFLRIYRVVTSARSCNQIILYIYNVYIRRSGFLKLEDYKMRSKQFRLNWTNSMQWHFDYWTSIVCITDIAEWSMMLVDIRLREWCCSVSMGWA
jgi:hypothetical protein